MTITPLKIKQPTQPGPSSLLPSGFPGKTKIGPDYCFCLLSTVFHHLETVMSRIRWILESVNNVKRNKIAGRTLQKGRNETVLFSVSVHLRVSFKWTHTLPGCPNCFYNWSYLSSSEKHQLATKRDLGFVKSALLKLQGNSH